MELDNKRPNRGPLEPSDAFAFLRAQSDEAREMRTRAEALAEHWSREPTPRRSMVGLISCLLPISDLMHPVFEGLLLGIRGRLAASDCDLLLCATRSLGTDDAIRRAAAENTIARGPNALIAWGTAEDDPEFEPIMTSGLPTIFVDNQVLGRLAGSVLSSNVDAMAEVVSHLYATGRRRIAHISGHLDTRPGPDRLFGYRSQMESLGMSVPPEYVEIGDFFHESGYEAAKRLLALPERPDAIACASDATAIGAMAAIREAGLRIPDDIAVTGFDDGVIASKVRPALTTVRQDPVGMGTAAAEAVLRMLQSPGSSPPVVVVPTELIIRESSGEPSPA
jgi:LacI family transcriptional regulator